MSFSISALTRAEGDALLDSESIAKERRDYILKLDARYAKQYHEVTYEAPIAAIEKQDGEAIKALFHAEHNRLYGYSLEEQGTPVEIINVRLQAIGRTDKPSYTQESYAGADPSPALKGERTIIVPETAKEALVPVYDGHATKFGYRIPGPAVIEQENTSILVTQSYDCVCDQYGSFAVYEKGREELVKPILEAVA